MGNPNKNSIASMNGMDKLNWVGKMGIAVVLGWDVDAMFPHVAAHSWLTLGYVSIFLVGHAVDYFTTGSLAVAARRIYQ